MPEVNSRPTLRRSLYYSLLLLIFAAVAMVALMSPLLVNLFSPTPKVGQVAEQDVLASQPITYVSEVLTEQERERAAISVPRYYTSPDTSIARQQLERLRATIAYISSVRADTFASTQQKLEDLSALEDIHFSQETAQMLLSLSDARWQAVQQEAISVLEQIMRRQIRPENLEETRATTPAMVSLALPEVQAKVVVELASAFVTPNSQFNESLTETARQNAREAVNPVTRSYAIGQTVVQRGEILSAEDVEALQQLGLAQPQRRWQDLASSGILVVLVLVYIVLYFSRSSALLENKRALIFILVFFLVTLLSARLTIPGHAVIPYAFPVAAYGLLIAALFGAEVAMVTTLPLGMMVAYGLPKDLELTLYYVLTSLFGILALGRARRLSSFFSAGGMAAAAGMAVIVVFRLTTPGTDWLGIATLAGAALFYGLAATSLTIIFQFFLAQYLGMTSPMQLMELTRPDHPLLQLILHNAPGTYQHSLQVANLAEQAAERIGADTLLTRVGALYHDTGKALNPMFFIENQMPGFLNPHEDLDPATSAATIIRHVSDGLELANKYRLPRRVSEFITEHHGTMLTRYQYVNAVNSAGGDETKVDVEKFRYPGPRPRSRETAILMLADGCEARVRAERPKDENELRAVIKNVIENRISMGQLDETNLTLRELDTIATSFTATLKGIYHPRIQYPKLEGSANKEETVPLARGNGKDQPSEAPATVPREARH